MSAGLEGNVAIVTGGSRGIGLAVSTALADAGVTVAILARDGERASAAARALPGSGHEGVACDVAESSTVKSVVAEIGRKLGPVGILINNAGITRDGLVARMSDADFDTVLDVNLRGAFAMIRACARFMMRRRRGSIVNVSSVVGISGNPGQANYVASKAGLIGMTKAVALELAPRGIRCNAVAPGFIETEMTGSLSEAYVARLRDRIPLGRLGTPEDVAKAVTFLAGPASGYITGQVLTVDGGMVMQ